MKLNKGKHNACVQLGSLLFLGLATLALCTTDGDNDLGLTFGDINEQKDLVQEWPAQSENSLEKDEITKKKKPYLLKSNSSTQNASFAERYRSFKSIKSSTFQYIIISNP